MPTRARGPRSLGTDRGGRRRTDSRRAARRTDVEGARPATRRSDDEVEIAPASHRNRTAPAGLTSDRRAVPERRGRGAPSALLSRGRSHQGDVARPAPGSRRGRARAETCPSSETARRGRAAAEAVANATARTGHGSRDRPEGRRGPGRAVALAGRSLRVVPEPAERRIDPVAVHRVIAVRTERFEARTPRSSLRRLPSPPRLSRRASGLSPRHWATRPAPVRLSRRARASARDSAPPPPRRPCRGCRAAPPAPPARARTSRTPAAPAGRCR